MMWTLRSSCKPDALVLINPAFGFPDRARLTQRDPGHVNPGWSTPVERDQLQLAAAAPRSVDNALEGDRALKNTNWGRMEPASVSDKGADNQREANQGRHDPECQ